eukprot:TRINITY_DN93523_c0_g1_i1.p1 TRINITY_DN93523_c0_g1~~TRINITY_DN93523_c0_g1_i1.p1  ORF type:complete len:492 (+),score=85.58 TRINITY_DN93523_c0_g1_i1:108-1583(+)
MRVGQWAAALVLACLRTACEASYTNETETQLRNRLMANYRADAMPRSKNQPVEVDMNINVASVPAISQISASITLGVWLRNKWVDKRLTWPVRTVDGACVADRPDDLPCQLTFQTNREFSDVIWTPDITLINTAERPLMNLYETDILVYNDGSCIWSRPGMLTATCKFELADFPNDVQLCHMEFGSWSFDTSSMVIFTDRYWTDPVEFDPRSHIPNEEWLTEFSSSAVLREQVDDTEHFREVFKVIFRMTRKAYYYDTFFVKPAWVFSSCILLSVFIPWNSGERISYMVSLVLTLVLFLTTVARQLPKTDQAIRLTQTFSALLYTSIVLVLLTIVWIRYCDIQHTKEETAHRARQTEMLKRATETTGNKSQLMQHMSTMLSEATGLASNYGANYDTKRTTEVIDSMRRQENFTNVSSHIAYLEGLPNVASMKASELQEVAAQLTRVTISLNKMQKGRVEEAAGMHVTSISNADHDFPTMRSRSSPRQNGAS